MDLKGLPLTLIAAVASVTAFQNTDSAPHTTFRSTTRLVQVNVVAVNKNGEPVKDLQKEDFTLLEDGHPQTVAVFVAEQAKPVKPPTPPPNEFSNQLPSTNPTRSGYTVILIDWLNTGMDSRVSSRQQVIKLLQEVEMTDLVALFVLDRDLRVLHDFTTDRAELAKKLAATYAGLSEGPPGEKPGIAAVPLFPGEVDEHSPNADVAERRNTRALEIRRTLDTFSAIEQIASYLGTAPGRKSLVWVTSGFSSAMGFENGLLTEDKDAWSSAMSDDRRSFSAEMSRLLRRLNNADIAVYPVDARGLVSDPEQGASRRLAVNLVGMKEIAARTGGRAYYSGNDLDHAIRSALDDSKISYTLGYYPTNDKNDGAYHNLSVKINRPGVTLRYRTGYEAENDNKPKTKIVADLGQVFGNPLDTTSLPLRAQAVRTGKMLDVSLRMEPSTLTFRQESGRRSGAISVLYTFRPPESSGKIHVYSELNKLALPEAQYKKLLQGGWRTFRKQIPIPENATSLRLAVRDEESGLMGSVTIPITAVR